MPASTYAANALLNLFLRGVAATPSSIVYVALHTADPGNAGANEVDTDDWPAYARQEASGTATVADGFEAADAKASENSARMDWPANNGAAPVVVTHVGIWDAASAGNLLFYQALADPKTINPTDELLFHIGSLTITVD